MKRSFASLVESKIVNKTAGVKTWFDKLSPSAQEELLEVKKKWQGGAYKGKHLKSVCRAVIAAAKERGWKVNGIQSVEQWLKKPL